MSTSTAATKPISISTVRRQLKAALVARASVRGWADEETGAYIFRCENGSTRVILAVTSGTIEVDRYYQEPLSFPRTSDGLRCACSAVLGAI